MEQTVTIFLPVVDVEAFKLFQKYYVAFKMLDSVEAFNLKSGQAIINFDNMGKIGSIDIHKHYALPKSVV